MSPEKEGKSPTHIDVIRAAMESIEEDQRKFEAAVAEFEARKAAYTGQIRALAQLNLEMLATTEKDLGLAPTMGTQEVLPLEPGENRFDDLVEEITNLKEENKRLVEEYNNKFLELEQEAEDKMLSLTRERDKFRREIEHRDQQAAELAEKTARAPDTAIAQALRAAELEERNKRKPLPTIPPSVLPTPEPTETRKVPPREVLPAKRQDNPLGAARNRSDNRLPEDIEFGVRLRQARNDNGISQEELARELKGFGVPKEKVSQDIISKAERGYGLRREVRDILVTKSIMKPRGNPAPRIQPPQKEN